jgi:hypothetical protein
MSTIPNDDGAPEDVRARFQLTVVRNDGGPLNKHVGLADDGTLVKTPQGNMCFGDARRVLMPGNGPEGAPEALKSLFESLNTHQAISTGTMTSTERDEVRIVLDGRDAAEDGFISRTLKHFSYQPGVPAWFLLDYDTKGMSDDVRERMKGLRGFAKALVHVFPEMQNMAVVWRASTTAGIRRIDTGEEFAGGEHLYCIAQDGSEIPEIIEALHLRFWLARLGWIALAKNGALLVRSPVDVAVGSPERLAFEAAPSLGANLEQDAREPIVQDGGMIRLADLGLTDELRAEAEANIQAAKEAIKPHAKRVQKKWIDERVSEAVAKGADEKAARRAAEKVCDKAVLMPDFLLEFDTRGQISVRDVLNDPARFNGETLSDPVEGPSYGRGKARLFVNTTGSIIVNSFAHGGCVYALKHDRQTVTDAIDRPGAHAADTFIDLVGGDHVELEKYEEDTLLNNVAKASKSTAAGLRKSLRERRTKVENQRAETRRQEMDKKSKRARIIFNIDNLHGMTEMAEDALIKGGQEVYWRGKKLVRPVMQEVLAAKGRKIMSASLDRLDEAGLVDRFARVSTWGNYDKDGTWMPMAPSRDVAAFLLRRAGEWDLLPIDGLLTAPLAPACR